MVSKAIIRSCKKLVCFLCSKVNTDIWFSYDFVFTTKKSEKMNDFTVFLVLGLNLVLEVVYLVRIHGRKLFDKV